MSSDELYKAVHCKEELAMFENGVTLTTIKEIPFCWLRSAGVAGVRLVGNLVRKQIIIYSSITLSLHRQTKNVVITVCI